MPVQCETIQYFNEIEIRLNQMKQNLIHLININNDKHLNKIDTILSKEKAFGGCDASNNTLQLEEIKMELSNQKLKLNELIKRLDVLEINFQNRLRPQQKEVETIDSIVNQINLKLDMQTSILEKFDKQITDLPNTSSKEVNIISKHILQNCL